MYRNFTPPRNTNMPNVRNHFKHEVNLPDEIHLKTKAVIQENKEEESAVYLLKEILSLIFTVKTAKRIFVYMLKPITPKTNPFKRISIFFNTQLSKLENMTEKIAMYLFEYKE